MEWVVRSSSKIEGVLLWFTATRIRHRMTVQSGLLNRSNPNGIKGRCKSFPSHGLRLSYARQCGHYIDISFAPCGHNLGIFRHCNLVKISTLITIGPSGIDRKYIEVPGLRLA